MEKHLLALRPETKTLQQVIAERQLPERAGFIELHDNNDVINFSTKLSWNKGSNGYEEDEEVEYYEGSYNFIDISGWNGIAILSEVVKLEMQNEGMLITKENNDQRVVVLDKRYNEEWGGFYLSDNQNTIFIMSTMIQGIVETGDMGVIVNVDDMIRTIAHELCHSFQDTTNYEECNKLGYDMNPLETDAYVIGDKIRDLYNEFQNGEETEHDAMLSELKEINLEEYIDKDFFIGKVIKIS